MNVHDIRGPRAQLAAQGAARAKRLDQMPAQRAEVQARARKRLDRARRCRACQSSHGSEPGEARLHAGRERQSRAQSRRELPLSHHVGAEVALVEEEDAHSAGA